MSRDTTIERETNETKIRLTLDLDGGDCLPESGIGFFDHMLELLARHAGIGLTIVAEGDLDTGAHHTVEDVGIVFGQALDQALGDRRGIGRFGSALVPMDEALAECALDISGRPLLAFRGPLPKARIGDFETELTEEFFGAVARSAGLTLHLEIREGTNVHHMIEACFKAFARALRIAVAVNPDDPTIPSTKGTLTS